MRTASALPWIGLVALSLAAGGCEPPGLVPYDDNTKFRMDASSSGFTLTVDYSRRHFIPEPEAVTEACRNALVTVAQDIATRRGRRIQRIDEQRIAIKLGRNEHSNMSFCTATAPVYWQ